MQAKKWLLRRKMLELKVQTFLTNSIQGICTSILLVQNEKHELQLHGKTFSIYVPPFATMFPDNN